MERGSGLVKTGLFARLPALAAVAGRAVLDQMFPPVCLACNGAVSSSDGLCTACWAGLRPISAPLCPVLGLPFATDLGAGALSAQAIADPPVFKRARSAVVYNEIARRLVARLKYGDRPEIALLCARMMAGAGHEMLDPEAVLVPVPLHRSRQLMRRYNQSAELARLLARLAKCGFAPDLVVRHRPTRQQVGLNAGQRARNVEGAFSVAPGPRRRFEGRRLVVVDDVLTTGATVSAVAKALRRGGFASVEVLSFARVVPGEEMI